VYFVLAAAAAAAVMSAGMGLGMGMGIAKSWAVVGAGPCGIAAVGRLTDHLLAGRISRLVWVDPSFTVGRMGQYYRNVPANTPNQDLIRALDLCPGFNFQVAQQARRQQTGVGSVMVDLSMEDCHALGYFVDALEDATAHLRYLSTTDELKGRFELIHGTAVNNHAASSSAALNWTLNIQTANESKELRTESVDAMIYACGGTPLKPLFPTMYTSSAPYAVHSLDSVVDPIYVQSLMAQLSSTPAASRHWVVIGSSHSAMLIIMNLVSAGVTNITNVYRSDMKFQHKLSTGGWKYVTLYCLSTIE
jgi:cation diffusion facilitator CzcD-associated flavoprotein CzcO